MSARDAILGRVRRAALHRGRHPGTHHPPALGADWDTFSEALARAGGELHGPLPADEASASVAELARRRAEGGRIVAEPGAAGALGRGPWEPPKDGSPPQAFADVAVAVLQGVVAVAESGAVAVTGREAPHRALPFLARHLVLLVPSEALVADLHAGFAALPPDALAHHHLTWICGPSKTADIEQTLVLGAHGPLSLDVVGVDPR